MGGLGFAAAVAASVALGWPPAPAVHDEFSYLLASDTFAHGRLTNPTHPLWQHFETFHVLQVPSYASKYPPGSALFLALGQVLTGYPIVGVWIGYAFMCAAVTWMLQAWLRPRWVLWGGILVTLWFVNLPAGGVYWASSYWGGAVPAGAGALVLGGVRRIQQSDKRMHIPNSMWAGLGLLLLANTRPFEGFFFSLPIFASLMWWVGRRWRKKDRRRLFPALTPALAILLAGTVATARYNSAVTGTWSQFPYTLYAQQYDASSYFVGRRAPPLPAYRHPVMRCFYLAGRGHAHEPSSFQDYVRSLWQRSQPLTHGLLPFFIIPFVLAVPWVLRRDRPWLPLASMGLSVATFLVNPWILTLHYGAPMVGAYFLLLALSARRLNVWRVRQFPLGATLTRLTMVFVVLFALVSAVGMAILRPKLHQTWSWQRATTQERLSGSPEKQLVLVQYGPHHNADQEWVYNAADIDGSRVVWARAMGPTEDAKLLRYFSDRHAWMLRIEDDDGPYNLVSVNSGSLQALDDLRVSAGELPDTGMSPSSTCAR